MGTLAKYNENLSNIPRFGSDYLPYVSGTDTRPDSLTGIAYPAGDTLLRNVSHGNPIAGLKKKWLSPLSADARGLSLLSGIYSAKLNAVGTTLADQKLLSDPLIGLFPARSILSALTRNFTVFPSFYK